MSSILGFIFLAFGGMVILKVAQKYPQLKTALIVAFIIRAFFALVHYYVVPLPDSQGDAVSFEHIAADWARSGFFEVVRRFQTGFRLYPWVIAIFYSLFGRSHLMAQAINVFLGSLIVYNVFHITSFVWGEKYALSAAWGTALFPTLVLYSAITMREVMIVFSLTLGTLYFVRWLKKDFVSDFLRAILIYGVSVFFHTGMLPAVFVITLAGLRRMLDAFALARTKALIRRSFLVCFVLLLIFFILTTGWGLEKVGRFLRLGDPVEALAIQQKIAARSRAAYLQGLQPHNLLDLFLQIPIRIVYFLFMPFPWLVNTTADLLGLVIALFNFVLSFFVLKSLLVLWEKKEGRWVFWALFALLIVFALSTSNYGTAIRHSAKLVPLVFVVARIPMVRLWRL